jgi:hypothetical protein
MVKITHTGSGFGGVLALGRSKILNSPIAQSFGAERGGVNGAAFT